MKVAICDDQPLSVARFTENLKQYMEKRVEDCDVDLYSNPIDMINAIYENGDAYDIFFIDIEMPLSGEKVVDQVRRLCKNSIFVFLSANPGYGNMALREGLDAYVYKSMTEEELEVEMDYIMKLYKKDHLRYVFKTKEGEISVKVADIECIEAIKRKIVIHLVDGVSLEPRGYTLLLISELPEFTNFFRISRSFLVNSDNVEKVKNSKLILKSGKVMRISADQYQRFLSHLHRQ